MRQRKTVLSEAGKDDKADRPKNGLNETATQNLYVHGTFNIQSMWKYKKLSDIVIKSMHGLWMIYMYIYSYLYVRLKNISHAGFRIKHELNWICYSRIVAPWTPSLPPSLVYIYNTLPSTQFYLILEMYIDLSKITVRYILQYVSSLWSRGCSLSYLVAR